MADFIITKIHKNQDEVRIYLIRIDRFQKFQYFLYNLKLYLGIRGQVILNNLAESYGFKFWKAC